MQSHGTATGQRHSRNTFSARRWNAIQEAQARFAAEAQARGAADAAAGRPQERNAGAAYISGYQGVAA